MGHGLCAVAGCLPSTGTIESKIEKEAESIIYKYIAGVNPSRTDTRDELDSVVSEAAFQVKLSYKVDEEPKQKTLTSRLGSFLGSGRNLAPKKGDFILTAEEYSE